MGAQLDPLRIQPASHAQAAASYGRVKLAALADTDTRSLNRAKKLYPEVPRFSDIVRMLEIVHPDIVVIATSPESHCALVARAARCGAKAILCEKPISHNIREAREVILLCRKCKALLFVNHVRRFDPLIRALRENLRGGYVRDTFLGALRSAIAYYDKGLYHGGTHFIDLLRFFLGEVRWVSAVENIAFPKEREDIHIDALLGFDGATAALQYFDSNVYALSEVSFFGDKGRLNLRQATGLEIEMIGIRTSDEYSSYRELNYERVKRFGGPRSFLKPLLPHIVDCLEGRDEPVSTGEDALRALEVIHAMEQSARKGGKRILLKHGHGRER